MQLVSVVIPAFNRGAVLPDTIGSVQAQTHQDFEILVVDDGSTDDTRAVVNAMAHTDRRIRYIAHPRNLGAQKARNTGIRAAKGGWIAFLDSDDRWLPQSIELRLRIALQNRREVIHSECFVLSGNGPLQTFGTPCLSGDVYQSLLRKPGPTFPSLLVSRDGLAEIGRLDETLVAYQEWDTVIRLARRYQFEFIPNPTFIYDCRSSDAMSKDQNRNAIGYEQVIDKHRSSILRHLGPRMLAAHYQTAADLYRRAGNEHAAQRSLRRAFFWWPFRPRTIFTRIRRPQIRK